jgi:hypothetical protein
MPAQIDAALVTQFSAEVHQAAQQSKARLRGATMMKLMSGEVFAYDGLGTAEMQELAGRINPTTFSDIDHKRRKITRRRFVLTLPVDAADVRSVLISPKSEYASAVARAAERVYDRVVLEAAFATVFTGREFGTSVSFAADGGQTVVATAGVTYDKLLELGQNFIDREVGNENGERLILCLSGDEHTSLMKELELTSGDYTRQTVVDGGKIGRASGFDLTIFGGAVSNPLLSVTLGVRSNVAMSARGMCVGMSKELGVSITERNDLVETSQVQAILDMGAVRTEGVLVQKMTSTD